MVTSSAGGGEGTVALFIFMVLSTLLFFFFITAEVFLSLSLLSQAGSFSVRLAGRRE
jgi:hypothetical protein